MCTYSVSNYGLRQTIRNLGAGSFVEQKELPITKHSFDYFPFDDIVTLGQVV